MYGTYIDRYIDNIYIFFSWDISPTIIPSPQSSGPPEYPKLVPRECGKSLLNHGFQGSV